MNCRHMSYFVLIDDIIMQLDISFNQFKAA